jgi:hypothetical protein
MAGLVTGDELDDLVNGSPADRSLSQPLVLQSFEALLTVSSQVTTKGTGADAQHPCGFILS